MFSSAVVQSGWRVDGGECRAVLAATATGRPWVLSVGRATVLFRGWGSRYSWGLLGQLWERVPLLARSSAFFGRVIVGGWVVSARCVLSRVFGRRSPFVVRFSLSEFVGLGMFIRVLVTGRVGSSSRCFSLLLLSAISTTKNGPSSAGLGSFSGTVG